jgi:hypothetical protein
VLDAPHDMTVADHVGDLFGRAGVAIKAGASCVIIDLHDVDAADTKLIACLVALYQLARCGSGRLELRLSQAVINVAEVCRLDAWLRRLASGPSAH